MTLEEKVGQLVQLDASWGHPPDYLGDRIRRGGLGAILNTADAAIVAELQRIARDESRLGIPLLAGRDVIHGFQTVMPIPLGQAASWNPALVGEAARLSAAEAATAGINWTFAPMIDITRDPRWGRVAESPGEDPFLAERLAEAQVRGVQGDTHDGPLLACAKHFVGYGASESGRDYASTNIPQNEMRNVFLRPFAAAVRAGVGSLMTSFSDIDGLPATANEPLLQGVLRDEWGVDGLVVSDWDSVRQLTVHGLTDGERGAALAACRAGVDMEMTGESFARHLAELGDSGELSSQRLDEAVANVLRVKFRRGLFDWPAPAPAPARKELTDVARRLARESLVLLRNEGSTLPIDPSANQTIAVLGPLADAPYQQMGTWVFDGDESQSVTPLADLRAALPSTTQLHYHRVLKHSRDCDVSAFDEALDIARNADVVMLFLGEESILSGEAHSRADIRLPGAQESLVQALAALDVPVVGIIMAGRPLALDAVNERFDALIYAWHPGSQAGPAIVDVVLGTHAPSGRLPITFPRVVGQIPIYYNQKNTGKPPTDDTIAHIDALDSRAPQTSVGMSAYHLDAGFRPLYPFGFGLNYSALDYSPLTLSAERLEGDDLLIATTEVTNTGSHPAIETVQLYLRDVAASLTRPVRELIGFEQVALRPAEVREVRFELNRKDLGFFGHDGQWRVEPGEFHLWVGANAVTDNQAVFHWQP